PEWEEKTSQGFWRGRDSRRERLELVKLSRRNPELIDAALTNFFFFKQNDELYGPKVKHVSFFDFFKYKYQVNIDGTVAAYRLPYLLAGDSLVFKHNSTYYEHFYKQLRPWEHYIPFEQDLSDLEEKLRWAMDNDEKAKQIAENGSEFARSNLLSNRIFCYYYQVLTEYASRQTRSPRVYDDMEEVTQPDGSDNCLCSNSQQLVGPSTTPVGDPSYFQSTRDE
ncbi:putative KDEL motif-containing protein 1 isoform X1, partial [Apostichopus japonicus]